MLGGYAGYLGRFGMFGAGVEADATTIGWEDWLLTLRGRAGIALTESVFAYGTGGWAWQRGTSDYVYGLGMDYKLGRDNSRTSLRLEYLRVDDLADTQIGKLGLHFKLN